MCRIKIPQQDFALKRQGGLMREGRRICGTLRYMYLCTFICSSFLPLCDLAKAYCLVTGNSFYLMTAPDCCNGCREATTITEGISEQC